MSISPANVVQSGQNLNDLSLPKSFVGNYERRALEAPSAQRAEDSIYISAAPNKYEGLRRTYQTSIDAMNRLPAEERSEQMYPGMQIVKAQLGAWEHLLSLNLPELQNGIPAEASLVGKLVQSNGKISYKLSGLKLGVASDSRTILFGDEGTVVGPAAAGVHNFKS